MDVNVKLFEGKLDKTFGGGVYEIYIQTKSKEELLFVGESIFVLVSCAFHLHLMTKGRGVLGFIKEIVGQDKITLVFDLYDSISDKEERKNKEKEIIRDKHPIMQSGDSDRVKSIEEMIDCMTKFLNE